MRGNRREGVPKSFEASTGGWVGKPNDPGASW